jgi:hypothetical protein
VADDEAALKAKLAALEAEVKADADAARVRKEAALAKLREQRAAEQAAKAAVAPAPQPAAKPKAKLKALPAPRAADEDDDSDGGIGGALELATRANRVQKELTRKPAKGEKSWIKSGVASLALGPIGWLYAGSLREAVPASVGWVLLAALASKILPVFLLMPVLMVALPLSAIAGVVYALQYNRHGGRQRLFNDDKKQLPGR